MPHPYALSVKRYDPSALQSSITQTRYDSSSILQNTSPMTDEVDTTDVHSR